MLCRNSGLWEHKRWESPTEQFDIFMWIHFFSQSIRFIHFQADNEPLSSQFEIYLAWILSSSCRFVLLLNIPFNDFFLLFYFLRLFVCSFVYFKYIQRCRLWGDRLNRYEWIYRSFDDVGFASYSAHSWLLSFLGFDYFILFQFSSSSHHEWSCAHNLWLPMFCIRNWLCERIKVAAFLLLHTLQKNIGQY